MRAKWNVLDVYEPAVNELRRFEIERKNRANGRSGAMTTHAITRLSKSISHADVDDGSLPSYLERH